MIADSNNQTLKRVFHWVYVAIILFTCFKLTYGITNNIDILFADESYYLKTAYNFGFSNFFRDGFIYFIWLKLLSLFMPDMVTLYCWNYGILMCLTPVLFYVLFREMGRGYFTSALFSVLYLITSLNVVTWPFVTRFATAIILLIFIGVLKARNNSRKYLVALAGLMLLIYSRPEFLLSFILFSIVSLFVLIYRWFRVGSSKKPIIDEPADTADVGSSTSPPMTRRHYGALAAVTLALLVFAVFIKSPAQHGRSVMAFGQHYGVNLNEREKIKENPWTQWRKIMKDRFQTDRSMLTAAMNNPGEIAEHIAANISKFPKKFFYQLFPYNSHRLTKTEKQFIKWFIILIFSLAFFDFILYLLHVQQTVSTASETRKRTWRKAFAEIFGAGDFFFYSLGLLLTLPLLVGLFVVYPRTHYMLVFLTLLLLWLVRHLPRWSNILKYLGLEEQGKRKEKRRVIVSAVQAFLLLLIVTLLPWRTSGVTGFLPGKEMKRCSYIKRIAAIKDIPVRIRVDAQVRLFGLFFHLHLNYPFLKMYLDDQSPHPHTLFYNLQEDTTFKEMVKKEKINMIFVNKLLRKHKQWRTDPTLPRFIQEPPQGWERFDIPGCKEFLLVNKALMPSLK